MSKARRILESAHRAQNFPIGETRQHNGEPSPQVLALPFYRLVPKNPVDQLAWRLYVRRRGAEDREFRHAIFEACEEDILFWCNTVCWVFEPRATHQRVIPLNTWINQDDHIVWLDECFGVRDCVTEKSRDESLTWDHLLVFYRHWFFDQDCKLGMVSLNEPKADSDDSDSLGWKFRFLHSQMPEWWRFWGAREDALVYLSGQHKFHNTRRNSTLTAYASTATVGRGGRKTAWLMDEFAEWLRSNQQRALDSTQYTTHCRYWPSTFSGDSDRFFELARKTKSSALRIIADWKDNPEKRRGLYTSEGGRLVKLDLDYEFPDDYPFVLDGKVRSPYYDAECKRPGATRQSIARELDRDPQGAVCKVFEEVVIQAATSTCREPFYRGRLDFYPMELQPIWVPSDHGPFAVWREMVDVNREGKGRLAYGGPYAIGADTAGGSGSDHSSNSALEVFDISTGEQVLEFYSNTIAPRNFARLAFVLCRWLCIGHDLSWAILNPENQGIGGAFTNEIIRLGWPNCYQQRHETQFSSARKATIGYYNPDGGYTILSALAMAIQTGEATIRSQKLVNECGQYEIGKGGKCEHASSRMGDPNSQGKAHGDCAIAASLAWLARGDVAVTKPKTYEYSPEIDQMERDEAWLRRSRPRESFRPEKPIDFRQLA